MDDAAYEALMARLNEAYPSQPAYTPADVKLQSGQITRQQGQDPVMLMNPRTLQQGESNPIDFDQSGGVSQLGAMVNAGRLRGMLDMSAQDGMTPGYNAMGTMQLPEGYSASYRRSNEIGGLGDAQNAIMLAKQFGEPNTPSPSLSAGASRSGMNGPITYDLSGSVPLTTGRNPEAPQFRLPSSREEQPMVPPSRRDRERQPSRQEVKGAATAGLSHSPRDHSTRANAGLKFNFADGGHVDAALHLLRQHFDEGGFLSSLSNLFSGPDSLSTGEVASPTNWGDPELASDFFKADKAMRLAQQIQAKEPEAAPPRQVQERAPVEAAPRQQIASPPPAPAFRPVQTLPGNTVEPHVYPQITTPDLAFGEPVYGERTQRLGGDERQNRASAVQMDYTLGHGQNLWPSSGNFKTLAGTVPENFNSRFGNLMSVDDARQSMMFRPEPRAEISRAVSLARNLAPAQPETIPSAADALAAVEKLHNAGVYSGEALDKAGEMLGAHLRARDAGIPVEEALRLIRAEGPMMINQGMPREERPTVQPLAYTAAPTPAPAQAAINTATTPTTGKLTARVDPNSEAERANNVWNRMLIQESGGRQFDRNGNTITSPVGALGISQVMPSTGPEAAQLAGLPWSLERLRTDPEYNHALGRAYYEAQLERFGDPTLAAAAYNGGPNRVAGALRQARETGRPWTAFLRPETQNYVRIVTAQPRAEGGLVDDALHVVREHHADGEAVGPTMQQRLRETIASIDPERSQDQPVMDPATMGEAWNRARQNYQNFPRQEGEAVARPLELGARDVIGGAIAGEARAPGAQFRRGVADLLVGSKGLPDSGTLGFGVADAPMVTGIPLTLADMARDIGQGDYASTAMGAALPAAFYARGPLGAAGRRAVEIAKDYAKPAAATAAGVAANVLTPEDAEAAKLSKALNIIRTAERPAESRFISQAGEHGYFQPQSARERDPRLWHPISNTVLSRPLGEMTAEHRLLSGLPERKFIRPEDLEGASMIPALGDRTIGDSLLTGVNGVKFKDPVSMQAGHSFMYGPASKGPDRAVWASDPGVITILSNKARAASEAGFDPYLNYVAMSSRSGDYSHHMADTLRQMLPQAKVPKDVIAEFDRQMRENTANKWAAYGDWPGLKSKKLEEYLYSTGPGKARTKMAELMGQGQFQKAGMPDVGAARFAITDPELLHAVDYSAGRSIARLDPMGRKITDPAVPHKTYLHQLAAHPEEGYVGGFEHDIPFEVLNKEWIDQIRARDPAAAENPSQLAYTYRLSAPRVDFKPQVVDRLSKFLEMKKAGLIP